MASEIWEGGRLTLIGYCGAEMREEGDWMVDGVRRFAARWCRVDRLFRG
jgi:hypothetical protein